MNIHHYNSEKFVQPGLEASASASCYEVIITTLIFDPIPYSLI